MFSEAAQLRCYVWNFSIFLENVSLTLTHKLPISSGIRTDNLGLSIVVGTPVVCFVGKKKVPFVDFAEHGVFDFVSEYLFVDGTLVLG